MNLFHGFDASAYEFFEGLTCIDVNDSPSHPEHKPRYGFADRAGKLRFPAIYDAAEDFCGGLAAVKLKEKWGFIDDKGNTIIPAMYDSVHQFRDGLALVKLNGKYGYIDTKGTTIIPIIYEEACQFVDDVALVKLNGRYGCIDTKGNEAPMSGSRAEHYLKEGME